MRRGGHRRQEEAGGRAREGGQGTVLLYFVILHYITINFIHIIVLYHSIV